uniref:Uncharacterized protein n=1 Tax=Candidatus Berkiella cookevillensis TaxID=437022 RepID=A0A0Q9YS52_9GAMM
MLTVYVKSQQMAFWARRRGLEHTGVYTKYMTVAKERSQQRPKPSCEDLMAACVTKAPFRSL